MTCAGGPWGVELAPTSFFLHLLKQRKTLFNDLKEKVEPNFYLKVVDSYWIFFVNRV